MFNCRQIKINVLRVIEHFFKILKKAEKVVQPGTRRCQEQRKQLARN
jgi:hypothetical protein